MWLFRTVLFVFVSALIAPTHAAEQGEKWEYTTKMQMEGFSLPGQTVQSCFEPGWKSPPGASGEGMEDCKTHSIQRSGNTVSWKMQCPDMTGNGQMTFTGNSFSGVTNLSSEDGDMKITMSGKKLGSCVLANARTTLNGRAMPNEAEVNRQVAAAQARSNAHMKQVCDDALNQMSGISFRSLEGQCPAERKLMCTRLSQSRWAYKASVSNENLSAVGQLCKTSAPAVRKTACAFSQQSGDWNFLQQHCPVETAALAKKECGGRDFTSMQASRYAGFCTSYSRNKVKK